MYDPLLDSRYKQSVTLVRLGGDWSGLGSDLKRDRPVWIRTLSTGQPEEALRAWRESTELTRRLGPSFAMPGAPKRSAGGKLYQVADIPQRRWSTLAFLMERGPIGIDGACLLVEQLSQDLAQAETAGLQPQGRLEDQILIDSSGNIMICGHWERAVRADWAGPALLSILERLAGDGAESEPSLAQLKSRDIVGRLKSASTVAASLRVSDISPQRGKRQVKRWLEDPPPKKRRWPAVAILAGIAGAIFVTYKLLPLPATYLPDVQGARVSEAKLQLEKAGWKVSSSPMPSDYKEGQVLSQWPAPQSELGQGKTVKLRVAAPKSQTTVPEIMGLDAEVAKDLLAASGLRMRRYMVETGPSNQVQAARPAVGTRLRSGEIVTVTLAP